MAFYSFSKYVQQKRRIYLCNIRLHFVLFGPLPCPLGQFTPKIAFTSSVISAPISCAEAT